MSPETARDRTAPGGIECPGEGLASFFLRPAAILRSVRLEDIPADLVAGMTVAAVAIPQAIAYASIAELPARYGLYAAVVAAIAGSLWGCSRFLATGPVNASSLLVLPVLLGVAVPGTPEFLTAASLVAVMAGLLCITLAAIRFGALVTLASKPVLIGFTAGAAVHIAIGQVKHLLGLEIAAVPQLYRTVGALLDAAGGTNPVNLALGIGALVLLVLLRRIGPRFPAALSAIALAALAVWLFDLEGRGIRVVGAIDRSLPPPTWITTGMLPDLEMIRSLIVGSLAVAALGLIEATAASRTLARRAGDRLNSNQEFFGQGMANIAAGLFSGYPCSGSFTRSALAHQAGARTHLAGVFTGLTILVGMLLLAPLAGLIPRAAIAGVLMVVAYGMLDREGMRQVIRTSKSETAIMAITFASTLVLPLDFAVLCGVVFSLAFFVIRSSLPRLVPVVPDPNYRHLVNDPEAPVCPQLGIMNIRGPLFFGAVYHLEEELRHNHERHPGQNILVLRMHGVDICDLSGIEMLESTVRTYRDLGGDVFLIRPRRPVLEKMDSSGFLDDTLGRDHLLDQEGAIEYLFDQVLDPAVCIYECEHRVFAECQALEKHAYPVELPPAPKHPVVPGIHVTPDRFQDLAGDENAVVLDLREPEEYLRGHVPGARLLPLRTVLEEGPDLPRDRPLLLVCRSGRRTSRAIHMLLDMGYENLHGLQGGILAWRAQGLPVAVRSAEEIVFYDPAGHERS
jgi:SulP family sulfate permease